LKKFIRARIKENGKDRPFWRATQQRKRRDLGVPIKGEHKGHFFIRGQEKTHLIGGVEDPENPVLAQEGRIEGEKIFLRLEETSVGELRINIEKLSRRPYRRMSQYRKRGISLKSQEAFAWPQSNMVGGKIKTSYRKGDGKSCPLTNSGLGGEKRRTSLGHNTSTTPSGETASN